MKTPIMLLHRVTTLALHPVRSPPPDLDIWRAAQLMVKRYGDDAAIRTGMRADGLLADVDVDGAATWRVIIRAVEDLQRARREDEPVQ